MQIGRTSILWADCGGVLIWLKDSFVPRCRRWCRPQRMAASRPSRPFAAAHTTSDLGSMATFVEMRARYNTSGNGLAREAGHLEARTKYQAISASGISSLAPHREFRGPMQPDTRRPFQADAPHRIDATVERDQIKGSRLPSWLDLLHPGMAVRVLAYAAMP
jgi:hypothetical protein